MRKIALAVMTTISGVVLLFSYHTSTQSVATSAPDTDSGATQADPDISGAAPTAPTSSATASTSSDGTFTGDAVQTRYGAVQVEITVANGNITSAEAIQYPNSDRHDQRINAYAVPILNAEVVTAQSAAIDAVSGATVTSDGYVESLQSAIDAAHLG
jgi:uncharacterized protein with FMN-binding domain